MFTTIGNTGDVPAAIFTVVIVVVVVNILKRFVYQQLYTSWCSLLLQWECSCTNHLGIGYNIGNYVTMVNCCTQLMNEMNGGKSVWCLIVKKVQEQQTSSKMWPEWKREGRLHTKAERNVYWWVVERNVIRGFFPPLTFQYYSLSFTVQSFQENEWEREPDTPFCNAMIQWMES